MMLLKSNYYNQPPMQTTKTLIVSHCPTDLSAWLEEQAEQQYYRKGAKSLFIIRALEEFRNTIDKTGKK
jgi:hypothetical protein